MTTTVTDSKQTISTLGAVGVVFLTIGSVLAIATRPRTQGLLETGSQPLYVLGLIAAVIGALLALGALTAWVVMLGVKAAND